jgi:hypothetical protein
MSYSDSTDGRYEKKLTTSASVSLTILDNQWQHFFKEFSILIWHDMSDK